jgi:hypothetical protein
MPKNNASQVSKLVGFGAFAPHFGQPAALVLTSEQHSLHLTNAMSSPACRPKGRPVARIVPAHCRADLTEM